MLRASLENKIWGSMLDWPNGPWDQPRDSSNQDGHQPPENPDHVQFPRSWLWEATYLKQPVVGVELDRESMEAQDICIHFRWPIFDSRYHSRHSMTVKRIVRIQSKDLWTRYYRKKQKMAQKCENGQVEEKRMFHGTAAENIDSICKHGFQIDRPVVHGRDMGKGHYFTPDMWHADMNTDKGTFGQAPEVFGTPSVQGTSSESGSTGPRSYEDIFTARLSRGGLLEGDLPRHYMVLSKVLTGRSLRMHECNEEPKVATSDFYDSAYREDQHVLQYAVYNDSQAYPEYVIEYVKSRFPKKWSWS